MKDALLKAGFKLSDSKTEVLGSLDKTVAMPIVDDIAFFNKMFTQPNTFKEDV